MHQTTTNQVSREVHTDLVQLPAYPQRYVESGSPDDPAAKSEHRLSNAPTSESTETRDFDEPDDDFDSINEDAVTDDSPGGLLHKLEKRQDEVLAKLDELNSRIEAVLTDLGVRLDDDRTLN